MKIKLIALDMDGTTLCDDHHTVPPENISAIREAAARGIQMVVATGRVRTRIPEAIRAMPEFRYALTSNGAAVSDLSNERLLYQNPVPIRTVLRVFDVLRDLSPYMELYCSGRAYVCASQRSVIDSFAVSESRRRMIKEALTPVVTFEELLSQPGIYVEKVNFPFLPAEIYDEVWARLNRIEEISVTSSVRGNAEVNVAGANKADGLFHLCALLGIAPEEVLAVGDNGNDREMLRFAGVCAAPQNAEAEIRAIVDRVVASNEQAGVAQAIRELAL